MPIDFSVEGGVFIEADDEEVESLERALSGAANKATKAASGAEAMEDAVDDLTGSVATVSGATENLDEDLEEVEAELEDIVTDAGAAAGSLQILNGSMQSIDDADIDMGLDESGIDAINEKWQRMRNQIDDFEHRVDDVIPQRAAGQPLGDFLGDKRNFRESMDPLDGVKDDLQELQQARERLTEAGRTEVDRPFRKIPSKFAQGRPFRDRVRDRLDFTGEGVTQGPMHVGRILSQRDDDTVGKLAASISNLDDVANSQSEVIEALNREVMETVDTPALPAPDDDAVSPIPDTDIRSELRALDRIPREPTVVPPEGTDPAQTDRGARAGAALDDALGGFAKDIAVDADELDALQRQELAERDILPDSAIGSMDRDQVRVSESVVEEMSLLEDNVQDATSKIEGGVDARDRAKDQVVELSDSVGEATRNMQKAGDSVEEFDNNIGQVSRTFALDGGQRALQRIKEGDSDSRFSPQVGEIEGPRIKGPSQSLIASIRDVDLDELARSSRRTSTSLGFLMSSLNLVAGSSRNAEEAVEDLDDDVEDLGRSLAVVGSGFENLSANLGPFNISLSNLLITVPILLATLGPLIATLAGIAGAALAVAGAFASILAVGALEFTEKLQSNFAGIESTGDALKAIFNGLKQSVMEAIEPLRGIEIGGLGPSGIFVTFLRDAIDLLNMFAKAMAALLNMNVVEDFLLRMREALLGFKEDGEGGLSIIDGLKELMKGALPILGDFLVWLIDVTPQFLKFVGTITEEAGPAIADLLQSFLKLSVALTEVGAGVFTILLPALAFVFDVITFVIEVLKVFETEAGIVSESLFVLGTVTIGTALTLAKLGKALEGTIMFMFHFKRGLTLTQEALRTINPVILTYARNITIAAARTFVFTMGLFLLLDALGLLEPTLGLINDILGALAGTFTIFTDTVGLSSQQADILARSIKALAGLFLMLMPIVATFTSVTMAQMVFMVGSALVTALGAATTGLTLFGGSLLTVGGYMSAVIAELLLMTKGLGGYVSMQKIAMIQNKGLASTIWATITSMKAMRIATIALKVAMVGLVLGALFLLVDHLGLLSDNSKIAATGMAVLAVSTRALTASVISLQVAITGGVLAALVAIALGVKWIADNFGALEAAIVSIIAVFGMLVTTVVAGSATMMTALIATGIGAIIVGIGIAILVLIDNWDALTDAIVSGAGSIADRLKGAFGWLMKLINPGVDSGWWDWIVGGIESAFDDAIKFLGNTIQQFIDILQNAVNAITGGDDPDIISANPIEASLGVVDAATGVGGAIGSRVQQLAKGGYVEKGGLAFLHSNEIVVPEDKLQGMSAAANPGVDVGTPQSSAFAGTRQQDTGSGGSQIVMNIDNTGGRELDDRRTREIAEITRRTMDNRRRRETGR